MHAIYSDTQNTKMNLSTVIQQHNTHTTTPFYGPLSATTRVSRYQKKHSPTHHPDHHPIFISFFQLLRSTASSLFKWRAWQSFAQPLSTSSLVYVLVWSPPPHIAYIASPNQCLLFATHVHTIATCFAVVSRSYHLFLVSLSTLYLELYRLWYSHICAEKGR